MMKHELEKQLDALEKKGVDRRHFFKFTIRKTTRPPFQNEAFLF